MTLTAWSYGLVGLAYTAFALRLMQLGYGGPSGKGSKTLVLAAVVFSALWGWFGLALLFTGGTFYFLLSQFSDLLRYGAWCAFLLILLKPSPVDGAVPDGADPRSWMAYLTVALLVFGLLAQLLAALGLTVLGDPSRLMLFSAMAMPVLALVLLEQVFRNATEDTRWNIKPLSLGLVSVFLFDLYLFSEAVLFNRPDLDALSIRGAVHALVVPLLVLSSTRRMRWSS